MTEPIGYYVHHHGSGHLARATVIARACDTPVVGLSSLPEPAGPHPFAGWVRLPSDPALADAADPTAGGALHYAPLNSPGYATRMRELVAWCSAVRPAAVVVDLSVEVAALLRLAGLPVALVTLPGRRDDAAHELAYRLASVVVAPWPRAVYDPPHLHPYAAKTVYAGAVSRFDGRPPAGDGQPRRLVTLSGSGGGALPEPVLADGWTCRTLGAGSWSSDVHAELSAAAVVITHAGTNALAEIAALRRPAIVLPQDRPFGEQHATAAALGAAGIVTVLPGPPAPSDWVGLLETALARGGAGWSAWHDGAGASRVATALDRLVHS